MWTEKKPEVPAKTPLPQQPRPNVTPTPPSFSGEAKNNGTIGSTYTTPTDRSSNSGTARLGTGLRVKGEITGTEDLCIDGTVEGSVKLDEKKLTVGATAKVTADITTGDLVA